MNRRDVVEVLLLGATLSAAGLAQAGPVAMTAAPAEPQNTHRLLVIFDLRFAAACQFGAVAGQGAWLSRGIHGDVTPLWRCLLEVEWHRHATAIRGMTTPRSFQCLEQLVADRFWRVSSQSREQGLLRWALAPAGRLT